MPITEKTAIAAGVVVALGLRFCRLRRKIAPRHAPAIHRNGDTAINKKFLLIIAAIIGLILGGELLFETLDEIGVFIFEWAHKTLDLLYTHVFGFDDEASQKASAWTGLILTVCLLGWGGYALRKQYLKAKAAAPAWWAERKAELGEWWAGLPWLFKLLHIGIGFGLLGLLALFI